MSKKDVPFSVRQGDVLLVAADYRGNNDVRAIPAEDGRIVLAHGEVTGHAHAIAVCDPLAPPAEYFDADAERYLQVVMEATVRHEEHGAIVLRQGRYQQAFQVEEQGAEILPVTD